MEFVIGFIVGSVLGAAIALMVGFMKGRQAARQLADAQNQLRESFSALASQALDANSRRLTEQAGTALDARRELIEKSVHAVNERLEQVRKQLQQVESERKQEFGRLTSSVSSLTTSANELHRMLASTQRRGAWGERMAEDVLNLAGLADGVNYMKQHSDGTTDNSRPDFTFFLPNELKLNMDVKFPLERYKSYLDAETDEQRDAELKQLCQAVRNHIRAVAGRGYIDPKIPTVNYCLLFIPSEQIFSLVLACQPDLIDEAMSKRIVLTSPITLYAMLAVVRQAAEHVNLMKTADEVLDLLNEFGSQWEKYCGAVDKLGDRIRQASDEFEKLRTTRTNMLERPLRKIEDLREQRDLPEQQ
ncbi:MAG: DNA recombination protein RmuC [Phycisphaerae bacterium]